MLQGSASAGWDPSCVYSIYKQYSLNVYTCADENERFQNLIVNGWTRLNHTRTDIYIVSMMLVVWPFVPLLKKDKSQRLVMGQKKKSSILGPVWLYISRDSI